MAGRLNIRIRTFFYDIFCGFKDYIRHNGQVIYLANGITSIFISDNGNSLEADVIVDNVFFSVFIEYNVDTYFFNSFCSCKNKDCAHISAVLFYCVYDLESNPNKTPKKSIETKSEKAPKIEYKDIISGNRSGEWRYINVDENLEKNINNLAAAPKSRFYYSDYLTNHNELLADEAYLQINSNNTISAFLVNSNYYYTRAEDLAEIQFVTHNNKVGIKCLKCNIVVKDFCEHQKIVFRFTDFSHQLISHLRKGIDYNEFAHVASKQCNIPLNYLKNNFILRYEGDIIKLIPQSEKILTRGFSAFVDETLSQDQFNNKEINLTRFLKEVEKSKIKSNALLWDGIYDHLSYLEGTSKEGKEGLIHHISEVDNLSFIDDKSKLFFEHIRKLLSYGDNKNTLLLLKNNLEILNSIPNYVQIGGDHKIKKKNLYLFSFSQEYCKLNHISKEKDGVVKGKIYLSINGKKIARKEIKYINKLFIVIGNIAYFFPSTGTKLFFSNFVELNDYEYIASDEVIANRVAKVTNHIGVIDKSLVVKSDLPTIRKQLHISENGKFLLFEPSFLINDFSFHISSEEIGGVVSNEEVMEYMNFFKSVHPKFSSNFISGYFYLHIDELLKDNWFLTFFEKAIEQNIVVYGQEKLSNLKFNTNRANVSISLSRGIDWYEPAVDMKFGEFNVKQEAWIKSVLKNENYVKLEDGTFGVLSTEWFEKLKKLVSISSYEDKTLKISKLKFNVIDKVFPLIDDKELHHEILEKQAAFENYSEKKIYPLPKGLKEKLRPYQFSGYQWLMFLDEFNFGGILADDMGLGKTFQMITFLLRQKELKKGTSMVIVPRSLVFNWENEINKFAPKLKFLSYVETKRSHLRKDFRKYDVIISTYDIITRDIDYLLKETFNYVILDESQAIKNPASKRYKAMRLLRSRNKLVMTGTPIENYTLDLYAQFSFINPGFFGSLKNFKDRFSGLDYNIDGGEIQFILRKMISPFILRRKKEQVAVELPERTESVLYCEMGDEQRIMYETLREKIKRGLDSGDKNFKFRVFDSLMKLRQICNSPELVDTSKTVYSAKLDVLLDQIEELGEHKALIFSQFVKMLKIIRRELDKKGIKYAYLDGSTRDRQAAVNSFLEDDQCNIFLISLKAGNVGLNLTKADYVYIFDPWWNPAVEAQAIDRTHRIGQDKSVFAYKLICRDTIEEKIIKLQTQKKELADAVIQADEKSMKTMSKEELLSLFD